jgi:putative redox protein
MGTAPPKTQRSASVATLMMVFMIYCRPVSTRSSSLALAAFGFVQRLQPPFVRHARKSRQTLHSNARDHRTDPVTRSNMEPAAVSNERYQKRYKVQGGTSKKSRAGVTVRTGTGHVLETDLPRAMGGIDAAAQPVETLLAALAGCTQATALFVARNLRPRRLDIDRIEFDLRAARDERGSLTLPIDSPPGVPSRLRAVTGTVRVHAARNIPISDRDLALLREQTELRCPVANMMIASGCEMDVRWVDGSADETV